MNLFNCERYKMYLNGFLNNPASTGDAESLNKNARAIATAMTLTLFVQPSLRYCPEIPFS